MKFTTDSDSIQTAIKTLSKLAAPSEGSITFRLSKGRAQLMSFSELSSCTVTVPGTVEGEGQFAIGLDSVRDATRGRKSVELTYKNTMLNVKSGSYSAALATTDVLEQDESARSKENIIEVTTEQAAWLRSAIADVAIRPMALISSYMPVGIHLSAKGAFISCFDRTRMSFIRDKSIKGDTSFIVPVETIQAVLEAVGTSSFNMVVNDSFVEVMTDTVWARVSLPTLEENTIGLDAVMGKAKEVAKIEGDEVTLAKDALVAFLDNSKAVALKERGELKAKAEDGKLRLSIQTQAGKIQASLPFDNGTDFAFAIDYEHFDELVRKSGSEVTLKVVGDAFIVGKTAKGATVLIAFNQDEGGE